MKQFIKMIFASCLGVVLASVIVFFIFFSMLGALVSNVTKSFTPSTEKVVKHTSLSSESMLVLDLVGKINDKSSSGLFDEISFGNSGDEDIRHYSLSEITEAIDEATKDGKIEGIILKLEKTTMGYATAQQLRNKLLEFKNSGKPIYAYADTYDYTTYYVSSVANKLYLNPSGMLDLSGLSSTTLFYPQTLKKLGVEMQVFKVGTFKGAVEPYVGTSLSDANKLQIETYLNGLWQGTLSQIAEARGLSPDSLQAYANAGGVFNPTSEALRIQLVDSLVYGEDLDEVLALEHYRKSLDGDVAIEDFDASDKKFTHVHVSDLLGKGNYKVGERVAVLFAEGAITDSDNTNPFSVNESAVINRDLIKQLRKAADDDDIKAVVLRVNSPGGSAFLSELIHHEVVRLKEKKPIVVSMGNYAASGGYYISCAANKIVADPFTLTGSIGIFGMFPNFTGTAQKVGLTFETVKTADLADFGTPYRPMTTKEQAAIQGHIERGYALFLTRVAEGRGMAKQQVDSVAQGRVWLGAKALELGLVDHLGNLEYAIDEAARLAGLDEWYVTYQTEEKNLFERLRKLGIGGITQAVRYRFFASPEELLLRKHLAYLTQRSGIVALPPFDIEAATPATYDFSY